MKIQSFKTWCIRNGINPVSGYKQFFYVESTMRWCGYSYLRHTTRREHFLSVKQCVERVMGVHEKIADVVYYYYVDKRTGEDVYHIHIFYKELQ